MDLFGTTGIRKIFSPFDNGSECFTPIMAYKIGLAIGTYSDSGRIVVGRDCRVAAVPIELSLSSGLVSSGCTVKSIGIVTTPRLSISVQLLDCDIGIMITASHNPPQYNGFKICRKEAFPLSGAEGLDVIANDLANDRVEKSPNAGSIARRDISRDFAAHVLSFIDTTAIKPFSLVIDAGNGMAGLSLPPVFEHLPCHVTPLYYEPDGTFPHHLPSPIESENLKDLQKTMREKKTDLGVAFDGDADRMFLLQKDGTPLGGDMVTALVADNILSRNPHETILYNLICSRAVPELITRRGGTAIRTKVGHAIIKPLMKKYNAVFGGEHSGHFYFRDNWFADSGLIALLVCLELLSRSKDSLHEILKRIDPYKRSGEINSRVTNAEEKMNEVAAAFADGQADHLDGLTIQYRDWWFNLRPSNTEPLLRLNVEATSQDLLQHQMKKLLEIIRS